MEEVQLWNSTLKAAMKLPGVNVNRKSFLTKELALLCSVEDINAVLDGSKHPTELLPKGKIEKIAQGVINYHLAIVTGTSALAGLPGGWFMAGTIPADLAQFFGHVLCVAQKLMYLYGFPDLNGEDGKFTEEASHILTLFVGAMFGSQTAINGIKELLAMAAKGIPAQLGKIAITRTAIYQLSKQIAKFLGIKLSRDTFLKGTGKIIPLIGAPISGTITYFTFRPMAMKLKKYLAENYG